MTTVMFPEVRMGAPETSSLSPDFVAVPAGGRAYQIAQRIMDIVVAGALVIALLPAMLIVAAIIKLTSRGPVFFKQVRAGQNGRPFTMYKFRTMRDGAQDERTRMEPLNELRSGPVFKMADDPRMIRFGRFLRRSSLDELPQLFNVLAGHMAVVGPRPLWLPEAQQVAGPAKLRTMVKPGLTCLWQISGRSELSYNEWVYLDLYYIQHRRIILDLMILFQTIPAVLSGRGAY